MAGSNILKLVSGEKCSLFIDDYLATRAVIYAQLNVSYPATDLSKVSSHKNVAAVEIVCYFNLTYEDQDRPVARK